MISTKSLLRGLTALVSLDIILTLVAVAGMGATEINPLSEMFGFYWFMALKIVACVAVLYIIYKYCLPSAPLSARSGTVALLAVYGIVAASNTYHLIGAVA